VSPPAAGTRDRSAANKAFFGTYSVRKDIPVQKKKVSQEGSFDTKYLFSTNYSVRKDVPVQNIQSVGIFRYKMFSFSKKYSVKKDIPAQK
jgi:hypothetical protein